MQMDVQVGGRAESLDEGDRAGVGCGAFQACLLEHKPRDDAVDDAQQRREQFGVRRDEDAQRDGAHVSGFTPASKSDHSPLSSSAWIALLSVTPCTRPTSLAPRYMISVLRSCAPNRLITSFCVSKSTRKWVTAPYRVCFERESTTADCARQVLHQLA